MRVSQVYRWQIPMDADVVLRERRLKTRDGLFIRLQEGNAKAGAKFLPCRDSVSRRWKRRKWRC
ncbi:O-succinylbenzoate-CoA synthase [Klebsiella pneumoniae]|nr:O-succinylbenzoate-CoA synthase [Klebsiella pneumoniae]